MKKWIENIIIIAGIALFLLPAYKAVTAFSFNRLTGSILFYIMSVGVFLEFKRNNRK